MAYVTAVLTLTTTTISFWDPKIPTLRLRVNVEQLNLRQHWKVSERTPKDHHRSFRRKGQSVIIDLYNVNLGAPRSQSSERSRIQQSKSRYHTTSGVTRPLCKTIKKVVNTTKIPVNVQHWHRHRACCPDGSLGHQQGRQCLPRPTFGRRRRCDCARTDGPRKWLRLFWR